MANTTARGALDSPRHSRKSATGPIKPKLDKRFYEAIVLLAALVVSCVRNGMSKALDLSDSRSKSPESAFHCFVNKISQLCDSRHGGDTVTAFTVLNCPDSIQYRFGSNRRTVDDLRRTRDFIVEILETLRDCPLNQLQSLQSLLLRRSLVFGKARVKAYLKSLRENSIACAQQCRADPTAEGKIMLQELEKLQELQLFSEISDVKGSSCENNSSENNSYYKGCEALILALHRLHNSEVDSIIRRKADEGNTNERPSWCELRHAAGRLLSYLRAVQTLIWTRGQCPDLFAKFEVKYIESSIPAPNPLPGRRGAGICAQAVIGRMTSDEEMMATYKAQAEEWQRKFDLDDKVREKAGSLKPIVHAEVLVLKSLEDDDGGIHISRFYNRYKYIGCSKPTCRLCDYYFQASTSGVRVQPTHWNVYPNWRIPDFSEAKGHAAVKEQEDIMNRMLASIRNDAFRILGEKLSDGKPHDSITDPSYQNLTMSAQKSDILDDLTTSFDPLEISSTSGYDDEFASNAASPVTTRGAVSVGSESGDDEDGGASL